MKQGLAVVVLTHNEELHLARALASISAIADQVFVVDSGSTDRTVEIAKTHGAVVLHNKFINHAKQFQWAIDNAPISTDWVMRLDADEVVEPDLAQEIVHKLPSMAPDIAGVNLKRKHIFMGRWVRHGGRFPLLMLRIWRTGQGRIEDRWMDEHIVVWGGSTVTFDGGFADHNINNLSSFTEKHNRYATREAIDVLNRRLKLLPIDSSLTAESASAQASFKRLVKERVYNRMPFAFGATAYFIWRYIFQLGFLDGRSGLIYHFLQGYWYRFLVGAKLMELERGIAHLDDKSEIIAELSKLTGLTLSESS